MPMHELFSERLLDRISKSAVIAVLVIDRAEDALPLAKALLRGGVSAMELTLRTEAAFDALASIAESAPEMLAGIGTILTPEQVVETKRRNAAFGVAPGMNVHVVEKAIEVGLPFAPGVATPSDIEYAIEKGCRILKLFPAEPSGGLAYLKSINAPYAHLGIKYIPLGGVSPANLRSYLECPEVIAVGGSWIAPRDAIAAKQWDRVSKAAEEAMKIVREVRGA
jgi:2-dehydro-3-deoxyphosphogluconate aldolase / (4S)-4-hydroxy-2-oxoglutarate aldolase